MQVPGLAAGDVLLLGGGQNNTPVYRITGWDRFQRSSGTVRITAEQAAQFVEKVQAEQRRTDLIRIPYMRKDRLKIDGDLGEWKGITPLEIKDGDEVRARVYLGWNNAGLVAAFDVNSDRPWKSAAGPDLAFQGGAAVDVSFGPLEPARKTAGPGDARVVACPAGGTQAVEMLPELAVGMKDDQRRPVTYQTGQGRITFARVAPVGSGSAVSVPKAGGAGYVVEMRFPVRGLELAPGLRFRLDASVILADEEGKRSAVRLPWHSRAAGDMTVNDTYLESLLRPENWAQAVLEQ
jgi:hypothetical protein